MIVCWWRTLWNEIKLKKNFNVLFKNIFLLNLTVNFKNLNLKNLTVFKKTSQIKIKPENILFNSKKSAIAWVSI